VREESQEATGNISHVSVLEKFPQFAVLSWHCTESNGHISRFFVYLFLAALGFELRALQLLGRHAITHHISLGSLTFFLSTEAMHCIQYARSYLCGTDYRN
jgi:hypothetical protein